ncbi:hypothetical protein KIPB_005219 [Kipferlia bialata]|uniref:R domain-containing protein n=1 Tax=Kipferlia bialata TaxID=797122 RepID=A0A9K3GID3_9EUKA|nr:hypothetical protein KIPB_005219 [Kipferlia bialata]|eukprot:g5219.t1
MPEGKTREQLRLEREERHLRRTARVERLAREREAEAGRHPGGRLYAKATPTRRRESGGEGDMPAATEGSVFTGGEGESVKVETGTGDTPSVHTPAAVPDTERDTGRVSPPQSHTQSRVSRVTLGPSSSGTDTDTVTVKTETVVTQGGVPIDTHTETEVVPLEGGRKGGAETLTDPSAALSLADLDSTHIDTHVDREGETPVRVTGGTARDGSGVGAYSAYSGGSSGSSGVYGALPDWRTMQTHTQSTDAGSRVGGSSRVGKGWSGDRSVSESMRVTGDGDYSANRARGYRREMEREGGRVERPTPSARHRSHLVATPRPTPLPSRSGRVTPRPSRFGGSVTMHNLATMAKVQSPSVSVSETESKGRVPATHRPAPGQRLGPGQTAPAYMYNSLLDRLGDAETRAGTSKAEAIGLRQRLSKANTACAKAQAAEDYLRSTLHDTQAQYNRRQKDTEAQLECGRRALGLLESMHYDALRETEREELQKAERVKARERARERREKVLRAAEAVLLMPISPTPSPPPALGPATDTPSVMYTPGTVKVEAGPYRRYVADASPTAEGERDRERERGTPSYPDTDIPRATGTQVTAGRERGYHSGR